MRINIFSLKNYILKIINFIIYKYLFQHFGSNSSILSPLKIDGFRNITIEDNVTISYKGWLAALPLTNSSCCELVVGEGTCIGNFCHIFATNSIRIGKNVLIADKVYITDNLHNYSDVSSPIIFQTIKQLSKVSIGTGSWIGENVSIIGASVGENSVIGANSVVTKNIPSYCVAVGVPAKIIKRYCLEKCEWLSTNINGEFI